MPKFLVFSNYTASGSKGLLKEGGTNRQTEVEDVCTQLGGKVEGMYYAFGDYDLYIILDFPDNVLDGSGRARREIERRDRQQDRRLVEPGGPRRGGKEGCHLSKSGCVSRQKIRTQIQDK